MTLAIQLFMGVGLAAAAGLDAFLPMLAVGLFARTGLLELGSAFEFLARTDVLIVLGIATVVELVEDKIPFLDNLFDTVMTAIKPAAGTILASSVILDTDPLLATALGLAAGGGTALTVHGGKAALRGGVNATAPVHAGLGGPIVSAAEDAISLALVVLAVFVPVLAFLIAVVVLYVAFRMLRRALRFGRWLSPFSSGRKMAGD